MPPPAFVGTQLDRPIARSVLDLPLTTSDGRSVTLSSFHGRFVVLYDMMTLGRETSPVNTAAIVQAARAVQTAGLGDRVRFVGVTVDPRRDTPTRLAAYRHLYFDPPADWTLVTGSADGLATLWDHFGVYRERVPQDTDRAADWMTLRPLTYTVAHNDEVHFLDRREHDRFVLAGPAHVQRSAAVPALLDTFLDGQGRRDLTEPALNSWTARQVLNVLGRLTARRIPLDAH
jgi:protein SCO1/2